MYPSICPLCQEVCKFNKNLLQYRCDHDEESFFYSALRLSHKRNFKCCEISIKTNKYILQLNLKSNFSYIFDFDLEKSYSFDTVIPVDWNSFEICSFEQKIEKIIKLKPFS